MQYIHQLPEDEPDDGHWLGDNRTTCPCGPHYRWWMLQPDGFNAWVTRHRPLSDVIRTTIAKYGNVII